MEENKNNEIKSENIEKLNRLAERADEIIDFFDDVMGSDNPIDDDFPDDTKMEVTEAIPQNRREYEPVIPQPAFGSRLINKDAVDFFYKALGVELPEEVKEEEEEPMTIPSPKEIKEELDKYVIGQDEAKKVLSVAVANHYKRITSGDKEIEKSNILLCGPTGCGKTAMVKVIAKMLGVPCYIGNATSITAAGYVGDDIESLLVGLLRECEYDTKKAERGIVFIDEVDKIAKKGSGQSITRDVSGECVQQGLLKIAEGSIVGVPPQGGRKHPEQSLIYLDTTNILFIGSGAFDGIEEIVKHRLGTTKIGFDGGGISKIGKEENYMDYVSPQDFRDFGFIPEFVGRFPVITNVENLKEEDLVAILTKPKNSLLKQYNAIFKMDDVNLILDDDALKEIAKVALSLKTGARGLRNIMETILVDYMFDPKGTAEDGKIVITSEITKEKLAKKCRYKEVV